ncbi:hypothetical protein LS482_19685 [Sinomicrobium kalidii]|uniref:hypothetical protein n=1 Tax=Sinomicrobium kalidii TaxID=2900738 RepID=UPI001E49F25F|nr:hypothetical protein [Sinomicrobium kalidii]UGU15888.1 hypothetical protein LS482_19685 [Sinomicrobium kalidii]
MKTFILMSLTGFLAFSNPGYSQEPPPVNQTVIRLTIIKDTDKILMRKTPYGWMTPSVYYKERQTIREVLDSISESYGITISEPFLKGLFTYKYEFKPTADMRQLYTAHYESGTLKSPSENEEVFWMPVEEALEKLENTVPSLKQMTRQTIEFPEILWGGSFILFRENNKLNSRIEEDFYTLTIRPVKDVQH